MMNRARIRLSYNETRSLQQKLVHKRVKSQRYRHELKQQVIRLRLKGHSLRELGRAFGISAPLIRYWVRTNSKNQPNIIRRPKRLRIKEDKVKAIDVDSYPIQEIGHAGLAKIALKSGLILEIPVSSIDDRFIHILNGLEK